MVDLQALAEVLIKGDRNKVVEMTKQALAEGVNPADVLNKGLIAGMAVVGKRFKANEVYVPEVLIAARAMKGGMEVLQPALVKAGVEPLATVVLGTVKGDLHDIGKNLVGMMLTGGGLKVVDIGTDVPAEKFVEAIKANNAKICAMSALLTTTMPQMTEVVKACKASGLDVKTMIGGAPVTQSFADEIGADGYAADAASAADKAKELVGIK
jgi:5-methyltetrahydrofolate--homocysteine methyltransferase